MIVLIKLFTPLSELFSDKQVDLRQFLSNDFDNEYVHLLNGKLDVFRFNCSIKETSVECDFIEKYRLDTANNRSDKTWFSDSKRIVKFDPTHNFVRRGNDEILITRPKFIKSIEKNDNGSIKNVTLYDDRTVNVEDNIWELKINGESLNWKLKSPCTRVGPQYVYKSFYQYKINNKSQTWSDENPKSEYFFYDCEKIGELDPKLVFCNDGEKFNGERCVEESLAN